MKIASLVSATCLVVGGVAVAPAPALANTITMCWSYCSSEFPVDGAARMTCHINCCNSGGPPRGPHEN